MVSSDNINGELFWPIFLAGKHIPRWCLFPHMYISMHLCMYVWMYGCVHLHICTVCMYKIGYISMYSTYSSIDM